MSKRLDILKAITAHLETMVTIDNGFNHDLTKKVFRGRDRFGSEYAAKRPFVSILEAKASDYGMPANEEETVRMDDWILLIQGWSVDDVRNPTDPAYELVADVERALSMLISKDEQGAPIYPGIYRLGGMIAKMTLAQPVVRPAEEGLSDSAFFYLPIRIGLSVDIRQP